MDDRISTLTMSDGVDLALRTWAMERPDADRPGLLFFHGIESHMTWFEESAGALATRGFPIRGFDRRGSGRSGGEKGHMGSFHRILDDIEAVVGLTRRDFGPRPLIGIGLSLGANFMLAAEGRRKGLFDGIVTIAPGIVPRVGFSILKQLGILANAVTNPLRRYAVPIRDDTLTRDPEWRSFIAADSKRTKAVTARFYLEILRMKRHLRKVAPRIDVPLLTILADGDDIVDNDAMIRWHRELGSADVTIEIVEDCYHCVQFETSGEDVAALISEWIEVRYGRNGRTEEGRGTGCVVRRRPRRPRPPGR